MNFTITYSGNFPVLNWSPFPDSAKYRIYRGLTKENLAPVAETGLLQYRDDSSAVSIMQKFDRTRYWYQVAGVDKDGKETKFTDILTVAQNIKYPFKGFVNTSVKRANIMLDRLDTGEDVVFYLRKGAGERCPKCFDPITRTTNQQTPLCDVCYNTTFVGGFELVNAKCRIRNSVEGTDENFLGITLTSSGKVGWISNYPWVNNGDFIKTLSGEIYEIDNVQRNNQKDAVTVQVFELKLLETNHVYYLIAK